MATGKIPVLYIRCAGSGSSAARLARSVRDAEVGGSNPLSPTTRTEGDGTPAVALCSFSVASPTEVFPMADSPYRSLPSVDEVLRAGEIIGLALRPELLRAGIRAEIGRLRREMADADPSAVPDREALRHEVVSRIVEAWTPASTDVINATGVLIHTNLGRVFCQRDGSRRDAPGGGQPRRAGSRPAHRAIAVIVSARIVNLLRSLTGADAALVVNNNAAAVLLAVAALARGRDVVVSRGEAGRDRWRIPDPGRSGTGRRETGRGWDDQPDLCARLLRRDRTRHRAAAEGPSRKLRHDRIHPCSDHGRPGPRCRRCRRSPD